ncbi:MAG: prepilin-type N-terminal cleavage/methylation domain-containing protein [Candidatus Portnoybacteria bacterium]|nr:prepilin-type N-terminal cleavage/methylation domain-containing protein [Candidatus Portnoybacteria bacterium]
MLKNNIQKNYLSQQAGFTPHHFFAKSGAGFTLTELLVVMFIISLLSGLVLAGHRSGQKKYALSQATQQLVSDLRKAQNMAMSGVEMTGRSGYGIYANKDDISYTIYADKNDNSSYQGEPPDELIGTIDLPSQIKISFVSPLLSKVDIFFKPPEPTTYINANAGAGISGTITLELEGTSLTKMVTVTTAGLIYSN